MSLRTRVTALVVVGAALFLVFGVFIAVQFRDVVLTGMSLRDRLVPGTSHADQLVLSQTSAGGAISDVVLTNSAKLIAGLNDDVSVATASLDAIDELTDDEQLQQLVEQVRTTQAAWVATDVTPVLAALESGKTKLARQITKSDAAWDTYTAMIASSRALQTAIDDRQRQYTDQLTSFVRELAIALLLGAAVILGALATTWWSLRSWIIHPLERLQAAMRVSASPESYETPITPSGPPELYAVGVDAESMRRELVGQIDQARQAQEALKQDAPLVAAVRAELAVASDHELSGFAIHGELQPAEGVLAGDWWDCVPLRDGRTAIVIGDVSGHGAEAGVTALRTRTLLRQDLLEGNSPAHALAEAADSWTDASTFVTAVVFVLHADGRVVYANAGHHAPRLACQWDATDLVPTGPLLSALGGTWVDETFHLKHGDLIVAYTDGLIESRDAHGTQVGEAWVTEFIGTHRTEDLGELAAQLLAHARSQTIEWHRDDVTLVALRRV